MTPVSLLGHRSLCKVRCCFARNFVKTVCSPCTHRCGSNSNVQIGVTTNGKTVVCYHPTADIPYELTQPIERPDPVSDVPDTHDQVLKAHLSKEVLKENKGPSIEELSKMFFTTKHRWYPVGQYHMRRKKKGPKDRATWAS
uniref:Large ribosomal subunit protein mL42 n=1 Tax=Periophthalmus magnuspinnatus TaxID=409849 RepID=A0A3B4B745_9GOBI